MAEQKTILSTGSSRELVPHQLRYHALTLPQRFRLTNSQLPSSERPPPENTLRSSSMLPRTPLSLKSSSSTTLTTRSAQLRMVLHHPQPSFFSETLTLLRFPSLATGRLPQSLISFLLSLSPPLSTSLRTTLSQSSDRERLQSSSLDLRQTLTSHTTKFSQMLPSNLEDRSSSSYLASLMAFSRDLESSLELKRRISQPLDFLTQQME